MSAATYLSAQQLVTALRQDGGEAPALSADTLLVHLYEMMQVVPAPKTGLVPKVGAKFMYAIQT